MTPSQAAASQLESDLKTLLGLEGVTYKANLSKEALFAEAIANDRGRVKKDGPSNAQKAYDEKDFAKALELYRQVPVDAQGYEKANNPQQAVVYYKKFLDVSLEQEMYAGYAAQAKERISALGGGGN